MSVAFPALTNVKLAMLIGVVFSVTVIIEVDVKFPSSVVAVIVADPTPTANTKPLEFTVATLKLLVVQFSTLLVALEGATTAAS